MSTLLQSLTLFAGLALVATPALAHEQGNWVLRGGVGVVAPESTAWQSEADDVRIIVDDGTSAVISATYMLTPNWGFDMLGAWPFSHDIKLGTITPSAGAIKFAEVKHLPPTFSFQYHFLPDGKFQPFVGVGLNYTYFFDEKVDESLVGSAFDLNVDSTFGVATQLGADIRLNDRWLINIDLRYVQIEPDVTTQDGTDPAETIKIDINPFVYSLSVGYVF